MSPCSDFLPLQGRSQDFFQRYAQLTKCPFHLTVGGRKEMYQKACYRCKICCSTFQTFCFFDVVLVVIAATQYYRCGCTNCWQYESFLSMNAYDCNRRALVNSLVVSQTFICKCVILLPLFVTLL